MDKETAGRKPLPPELKKSQVNFYLTPEEEKRMRQSLIEVRSLIERNMNKEK